MASSNRYLVFAGSLRKGSFNQKLADVAATELESRGAEVSRLSLGDHPLPLYDGNLEAESGVPENGQKLHQLFRTHQGILIASPEYNAGFTPLLKNAIDWVSRVRDHGGMASAFQTPVFALVGASPGPLGAYRSLLMLRQTLTLGVLATVLPQMVQVPSASDAFDDAGKLKSERTQKSVQALIDHLVKAASKVELTGP